MNQDYLLRPPEHRISDEDYYDFVCSHHDCVICTDVDVHEDLMVKTDMGWMHEDCYNEVILNASEDGSRKPELI